MLCGGPAADTSPADPTQTRNVNHCLPSSAALCLTATWRPDTQSENLQVGEYKHYHGSLAARRFMWGTVSTPAAGLHCMSVQEVWWLATGSKDDRRHWIFGMRIFCSPDRKFYNSNKFADIWKIIIVNPALHNTDRRQSVVTEIIPNYCWLGGCNCRQQPGAVAGLQCILTLQCITNCTAQP